MTYNRTYYVDHREKFLEAQKKYYAKHKDLITQRRKQIINCECGALIYKNSIFNHVKSKRHLRLVEEKNEPAGGRPRAGETTEDESPPPVTYL